jgi:hypothetical protein
MPRMHAKPNRKSQPYVVTVRGPGVHLQATLDGPGGLAKLMSRVTEAMATVGGFMTDEEVRAAFPDHYDTLGVQPDATTREINEAYIKKMASTLPLDELDHVIAVAVQVRDTRAARTS